MADVNPQTTFHVAFTEKEYHLVMLALAAMVGGVKPDGHQRKAAAELNLQMLTRERAVFTDKLTVTDQKIAKAPLPDLVGD